MRLIPVFSGSCLAMSLVLGNAVASERWVHVGDLYYSKEGVIGKISINLDGMRRRKRHYEVWERVTFGADAAMQPDTYENKEERLTLWAIRCKRATIAKVTERVAGSFTPRGESLKYYTPSPQGPGAVIIELACKEALERFAEDRPARIPESKAGTSASLDSPPLMLDEELEEGDD